jgi:2-polyprenyl-6-methoxyphenol hydroxylase-like FAD-dependent oxidoreductase
MSPFPFVLMLAQDDNELIMGDKLREFGVAVEWSTELTAIEQHSDHVDVTLKLPDGGTRNIQAAWVAGCDGSRSPVRELSGIKFPGAPYEHTFFVADTEATGSMKPGELNVYLWNDGFHLFFPMRGKNGWRVIGVLPEHLRQRDDVTFEDVVPAIRQVAGTNLSFKACHWFSTYRIYHRAAERFRDRRCFLLGDAAHIHSPVGAQGMNTGLQDAYNLAWKLALVVQGRADTALLDTYERERIPVAKRLLETTDRAFQLIVADGWLGALLRTRILANVAARAMKFERVRRLAFRTISQIGISYPTSLLSRALPGLPKDAPAPGERFPWMRLKLEPNGQTEDLFVQLDDTKFNLLMIGQSPIAPGNAPATLGDFGGFIRIHPIAADPANAAELARAKVPQPSFYLLRPDGHVGLCGIRPEVADVRRYLAERVHLKEQGARSNEDRPSSGATPIGKLKPAA